jgi:diguanylate cyclase (GGDEF)-like protein/PAS domain S-box-containing protein
MPDGPSTPTRFTRSQHRPRLFALTVLVLVAALGGQLPAASAAVPADQAPGPVAQTEANRSEERNRQLVLLAVFTGVLALGLAVATARTSGQLRAARQTLAALGSGGDPFINALPDLIWQKDVNGEYIRCNRAFAEFFGRKPGEVIGLTDTELVGLTLGQEWRRRERATLAAGRALESEEWVQSPRDRHSLLLLVKRQPVYDDDGRLVGTLSIGRDISERHRAQQELNKRADYQRALLDNFPFEVWLKDSEGRIQAANRSLAETAGVDDPRQLNGKTMEQTLPPALATAYHDQERHAMRTRSRVESVERVELDGVVRWIESFKAPIFDQHGRLLGSVGFARDVTERETMEQALRDSEQRFRSLFEHSLSVMLLIDADSGRILEGNPAALRYYGYDAETLTRLSVDDINQMSPEEIQEARRRAQREEQNLFHFRHRRADGSVRDVDVYSTPVRSDGRDLLFSIVHDVTDKRAAVKALRASEQRFRRFFEDHAAVMLMIEPDSGRICDANRAAHAYYGFPGQALVGQLMRDIDVLPDKDSRLVRHQVASGARSHFELRHRLASGEERDVELYASAIEQSDRVLVLAIVHDITQRRRSEQALQRERDLFSAGPVIVLNWAYEDGWPVRDVSSNLGEVLGYDREDWVSANVRFSDFIHPADVGGVKAEAERFIAMAIDQFEQSYRLRHKNGEYRWYRDVTRLVRDEAGTIVEVRGYLLDQTALKQLEFSLLDQRHRLEQVIEATDVGSWQWNVQTDELRINAQWAQMLGYTVEELGPLGFDTLAGLLHPDDLEATQQVLGQHFEGELDNYQVEFRLRHRDGHWIWVHSRGRILQWTDGGKPLWMYGTHLDVSERKRSELALADQGSRLQYVIDATRVGTWEWNVQTGETRFNERWAEIVGYRLDELQPTTIDTWLRFVHPDDRAASEQALQRHFAGTADYYECQARVQHRDGHWVWVLDRGQVFEWTEDGKPLWMYGTHQDITESKQTELALRESELRLRTAGKLAYDLVYEWDVASGELTWFGDIDGFLGFAPGTVSNRLDSWFALIHEDDRPVVERLVERHTTSTEAIACEYRVRDASGRYHVWQDKALPVVGESGGPRKWVGVCSDISERRQQEEKLRLAGTVFEHAHEAIMITDARSRIIDVNEAFTAITGYRRNEVLGRTPGFLSSGRHDAAFYDEMWHALRQHHHWQGEIWNRRRNGEVYPEMLAISAVLDGSGTVVNYVGLFSDITALKEHQAQLEKIAYYDPLTKLPNRLLLGDRLRQAMAQATRHERMLAVLYLDLDGFKEVNDAHGHDVGDRVLIDVATRLRQTLRQEDTLARLGGDEFAAVLADLEHGNACVDLLPRLLNAASQSATVAGKPVRISASIGVTLFPQHEDIDADRLLRQADQAMYQAKLAGKNRYQLFDAEHDRSIRGQVEILDQIDGALDANEFELYYQPRVNMRSGRILGAEALIRWPLVHGGVRLPAEFLPFIEDHPLAVKLDEWVIDRALRQLVAWSKAGQDYSISINVSAYQLQQAHFIKQLERQLHQHPAADPSRVIIEVLETTALMDLSRVSTVIEAGQALGVTFALDDFGTGYSSLNYLKSLPAKQLKIDRGFVRDMLDDRDDLAILEGIMGLATAFGRTPIAEGVESVEHGEILLMLGCELAQGFGIGQPMPAAQFDSWARHWQPDPRWLHRERVAREDLPLMFAMVEHRAWVKAIESQLNGHKLTLPPLDERLCAFGQWLCKDAPQRYAEAEGLRPLIELHHQLHETAPRLLELHRRGDSETARSILAQLHGTSSQLVEQLRALLRNA